MDFSEFVAIVRADKPPELTDFERVSVYAHGADKDQLWTALGHAGIHPIYRAMLAQALHLRVIEELELQRERERRREEEARLEAMKSQGTPSEGTPSHGAPSQDQPPPSRRRSR
jgi:hypothetical protein